LSCSRWQNGISKDGAAAGGEIWPPHLWPGWCVICLTSLWRQHASHHATRLGDGDGFATLDDLVDGLMGLVAQSASLDHLASVSRDRYLRFYEDSMDSFNRVIVVGGWPTVTNCGMPLVNGWAQIKDAAVSDR